MSGWTCLFDIVSAMRQGLHAVFRGKEWGSKLLTDLVEYFAVQGGFEVGSQSHSGDITSVLWFRLF